MKTLSTVPLPAPEAAPDLDMQGAVACTATMFPRKGFEFWVCNPMDELIEAMEWGEKFIAHKIVAMQPKRVVINPADIARIEEA
jgi:hypothetical protein